MKAQLFIFSLIILLGGFFADAADIKSPFNPSEVTLSGESLKTIRFLKNTRVEVDFLGKIKSDLELYLDGTRVPVKQGQFKTAVNLYPLKEVYEFKVKRPGVSETVYPFQFKFVKDLPLPLRVRIESTQSKPIFKEKVFTGSFPSGDWIQLVWLSSNENVDPAYLAKLEREKAEREEERQRLAKQEEERIEREKQEREKMLEMQNQLARLEEEKLEKARRERERLEELKKEQARLEQERKEEEREAGEKKKAQLAEEKQEQERELASQLERENQLLQQPQYREPVGLSINQGMGGLSLKQTDVDLSSLNWMVNLTYQTPINEKLKLTAYGQGYLVPLSVTGSSKGPNVIKVGADLGYGLQDSAGTEWTPQAGFGYQTMVTSDSLGYRNLFGPRLGISLKLPVGQSQSLNSSLMMGLFPTKEQILGFGNNEIHFRTALQWKVSSSFISSMSLGVDFSSLNLTILGTKLTASGYSVFVGLDL